MVFKINRNSHMGTGLLIIELIATIYFFNQMTDLRIVNFGISNFWTSLHPGIRLVIEIAFVVVILAIFFASKIGGIVVSLFYSIMWTILLVNITDEYTHGDKIWIIIIGGITFLISILVHLSTMSDSGYDYEAVVTKDDEI